MLWTLISFRDKQQDFVLISSFGKEEWWNKYESKINSKVEIQSGAVYYLMLRTLIISEIVNIYELITWVVVLDIQE